MSNHSEILTELTRELRFTRLCHVAIQASVAKAERHLAAAERLAGMLGDVKPTITLPTPTNELAVGDRVRLTDPATYLYDETGTVTEIRPNPSCLSSLGPELVINLDEGGTTWRWLGQVEKIADTPTPEPAGAVPMTHLVEGQQVRFIGPGRYYGITGTVAATTPNGAVGEAMTDKGLLLSISAYQCELITDAPTAPPFLIHDRVEVTGPSLRGTKGTVTRILSDGQLKIVLPCGSHIYREPNKLRLIERLEPVILANGQPVPWRRRLVFDFNVSDESPVVKGTWVTVVQVVSLIADGMTWADILRTHPELSEEDLRVCLEYATQEEKGSDTDAPVPIHQGADLAEYGPRAPDFDALPRVVTRVSGEPTSPLLSVRTSEASVNLIRQVNGQTPLVARPPGVVSSTDDDASVAAALHRVFKGNRDLGEAVEREEVAEGRNAAGYPRVLGVRP